MKSQDALISFARDSLGLSPAENAELVPFPGRASDRSYFRFKWAGSSAILMQYESVRLENSYFAEIAGFLLENGVPVPRIIAKDAIEGLILMEDLGNDDLCLLRKESWERRRSLYQKTLAAVHKLHSIAEAQFPHGSIKLMEPFDPTLYRWERNYFSENFVTALCGITLEAGRTEALEKELGRLAERITSLRRCLVHRDLQSQNVMIFQEAPFLIDFQGMRFGSSFYDLGSLLCDPYVHFADEERMELLSFYYALSNSYLGWDDFVEAFWQASVQRLMQALGAYGFLALKKGLQDYLAYVPAGLKNLRTAAEKARLAPLLLTLCDECLDKLEPAETQ